LIDYQRYIVRFKIAIFASVTFNSTEYSGVSQFWIFVATSNMKLQENQAVE